MTLRLLRATLPRRAVTPPHGAAVTTAIRRLTDLVAERAENDEVTAAALLSLRRSMGAVVDAVGRNQDAEMVERLRAMAAQTEREVAIFSAYPRLPRELVEAAQLLGNTLQACVA